MGVRRIGSADLHLHGGKAPSWLFERMRRLAPEIAIGAVANADPEKSLAKTSDPIRFQTLGCALGAGDSWRELASG